MGANTSALDAGATDSLTPRVSALEYYQQGVQTTISSVSSQLYILQPQLTNAISQANYYWPLVSAVSDGYSQLAAKFNDTATTLTTVTSGVSYMSARISNNDLFATTFSNANFENRVLALSAQTWNTVLGVSSLVSTASALSIRMGTMETSITNYTQAVNSLSLFMMSTRQSMSSLSFTVAGISSKMSSNIWNLSSSFSVAITSVSNRLFSVERYVVTPQFIPAPTLQGTGNAISGIVLSAGNYGAVITTASARSVNISTAQLYAGFQARVMNTTGTAISNAITTYNGTATLPTEIIVLSNTLSSTATLPASGTRTILLLSNLSVLVY